MSFIRGARTLNGFPKPGDELRNDPGRHSREGWVQVTDHASVYIEGKQYRHMREWKRPCAICGGDMFAFEKMGTADANSRFSNRTCKDHRGLLPAFEKGYIAWDPVEKRMVAGPACNGGAPVNKSEFDEIKAQRDEYAEGVMDQMQANGNLRREMEVLKAELAKHTLSGAMQETAKKFPWQG